MSGFLIVYHRYDALYLLTSCFSYFFPFYRVIKLCSLFKTPFIDVSLTFTVNTQRLFLLLLRSYILNIENMLSIRLSFLLLTPEFCFLALQVCSSIYTLICIFCVIYSFFGQREWVHAYAGSDIYQEMLVKSLANHFGAKLLIFDSQTYLGVRNNIFHFSNIRKYLFKRKSLFKVSSPLDRSLGFFSYHNYYHVSNYMQSLSMKEAELLKEGPSGEMCTTSKQSSEQGELNSSADPSCDQVAWEVNGRALRPKPGPVFKSSTAAFKNYSFKFGTSMCTLGKVTALRLSEFCL